MASTLAKQIKREEDQVAKLEARSQKLAQKLLAKDDYTVAMQLAREIDEQDQKIEAQWCADRKLAKKFQREEKVAAAQEKQAAAQDRAMARKLSRELNGTDGVPTARDKMRAKLGALRKGLSEMTNGVAAANEVRAAEPLGEPTKAAPEVAPAKEVAAQ